MIVSIFHITTWCLIGISIFGYVYSIQHLKNGCTTNHCVYQQTVNSDCIVSIPNTTYECTYKYKLCPKNEQLCYTKKNDNCPYLDCINTTFNIILNISIVILTIAGFLYILFIIYMCLYATSKN